MSLILKGLQLTASILRTNATVKVIPVRLIRSTLVQYDEEDDTQKRKPIDPLKDRSTVIPVETSIRYMQSKAYKEAYGDYPVWKFYRRNHKGALPPKITRKTCIRGSAISTGNPCPICRDEYLVLDYRNINLLKQFLSEHNGEILSYTKTGLCQKTYKALLVAIYKAKEYGLITFDVPLRRYDYSDWYKMQKQSKTL